MKNILTVLRYYSCYLLLYLKSTAYSYTNLFYTRGILRRCGLDVFMVLSCIFCKPFLSLWGQYKWGLCSIRKFYNSTYIKSNINTWIHLHDHHHHMVSASWQVMFSTVVSQLFLLQALSLVLVYLYLLILSTNFNFPSFFVSPSFMPSSTVVSISYSLPL